MPNDVQSVHLHHSSVGSCHSSIISFVLVPTTSHHWHTSATSHRTLVVLCHSGRSDIESVAMLDSNDEVVELTLARASVKFLLKMMVAAREMG